ncbi:hypothetical protein G9A89_016184 [Geosiphon pyriformis]|nr:hypothetical protein G9A89_016184 [Geosiphon pyriformis]
MGKCASKLVENEKFKKSLPPTPQEFPPTHSIQINPMNSPALNSFLPPTNSPITQINSGGPKLVEKLYREDFRINPRETELMNQPFLPTPHDRSLNRSIVNPVSTYGGKFDPKWDGPSHIEKILGLTQVGDLSVWQGSNLFIKENPQTKTRVVLGIGGFAFAMRPTKGETINVSNIETNEKWPDVNGKFKTNTVLEYDQNFNVIKWGYPALSQRVAKTKESVSSPVRKPVELFKLLLGDIPEDQKPKLPKGLHYKKAITDYLAEFAKLIKTRLNMKWPHLNFHQDVQIVMTVPAEFDDTAKAILRYCAYQARLLDIEESSNLIFTTEPEAAAIYCLHYLREYPLRENEPFMVVDCGGGTVDLTIRNLLSQRKIGEITMRTGGLCGSSYVDREFLKYLSKILGMAAVQNLIEKHYGQLQYLIQEFFVRRVKIPFNGNATEFEPATLDLEDYCPAVIQYVTPYIADKMKTAEWQIDLNFPEVKKMFDLVVKEILALIDAQIKASPSSCQAIFLVGGFGESPYVLKRVREAFGSIIPLICVGHQPTTAIVRGAVLIIFCRINTHTIQSRVIKWTYGIKCVTKWDNDRKFPISRKDPDGYVRYFSKLITCGTEVSVDDSVSRTYWTSDPTSTMAQFPLYISSLSNPKFCDGLKFVGQLKIVLGTNPTKRKRAIEFSLSFGKMEIQAVARIVETRESCVTTFQYDMEDMII